MYIQGFPSIWIFRLKWNIIICNSIVTIITLIFNLWHQHPIFKLNASTIFILKCLGKTGNWSMYWISLTKLLFGLTTYLIKPLFGLTTYLTILCWCMEQVLILMGTFENTGKIFYISFLLSKLPSINCFLKLLHLAW